MGSITLQKPDAKQQQIRRLGNVKRRSSHTADRIGIVVGLASEARLARTISKNVVCSGGRSIIAGRLAERLIKSGCSTLISFGIAGGLDPELHPGTLIVADRIVTAEREYPALPDCAAVVKARVGGIYGGTTIVASPAEKQILRQNHLALAVDLESGAVARAAFEAGVGFIAIRAVADPAWKGLPPAALVELDLDGSPRLSAVLWSVAKQPRQIPALIATARETSAALASLRRACRRLRT